ncbi:MAG: TolC family protein, partial [Planctomycetes bacterium]|nr:TolC family protein [Planctomycetota bacterium]
MVDFPDTRTCVLAGSDFARTVNLDRIGEAARALHSFRIFRELSRMASFSRRIVVFLTLALAGGCAHPGPGVSGAAQAARILPPASAREIAVEPSITKVASLGMPVSQAGFVKNGTAGIASAVVENADAITGSLTLEAALELAFQRQPRLRLFWEHVEQARGRGETAFAPFLPQISAIGQGFSGRNPRNPLDAAGLPAPEFPTTRGPQDFAFLEMMLQWTLWDFGRTYGRYQQAELGVAITQLQASRAGQTVAFDVTAAYFRVLQAQANLRVGQEAVRRAESILGITRKMLKAGLVERDRVLRAEVELAKEQRAVVQADKTAAVAVAALNLAIGINVSTPTTVVDRTDEPAFSTSLGECLAQAVDNRREFQVAQRSIEVAQEGVRVARAHFLPRVFAQGAAAVADGRHVLVGATETGSINL